MPLWKSRGLRGSLFEEAINETNSFYRDNGIALVQKIPTPITPIEIDKETKHITLAYFDQVSTVDYVGVAQSVPICFDCKECAADTFPLQNVHAHQVQFMADFERQQGIAFFLISYTSEDILYYLKFDKLMEFWNRAQNGGRKSFRFDELDKEYIIPKKKGVLVPYLDMIQKDLDSRE